MTSHFQYVANCVQITHVMVKESVVAALCQCVVLQVFDEYR